MPTSTDDVTRCRLCKTFVPVVDLKAHVKTHSWWEHHTWIWNQPLRISWLYKLVIWMWIVSLGVALAIVIGAVRNEVGI
ncbi:hypothetical protein [Polymorphospora lycopeni]|uniref:C2H2-type domain-containing protein n=1 Tax=Polymorphospora lycopeni TaxID=3140240 RepID=A0ABV5CL24_9ACTN